MLVCKPSARKSVALPAAAAAAVNVSSPTDMCVALHKAFVRESLTSAGEKVDGHLCFPGKSLCP